jgi:hypothetical protein
MGLKKPKEAKKDRLRNYDELIEALKTKKLLNTEASFLKIRRNGFWAIHFFFDTDELRQQYSIYPKTFGIGRGNQVKEIQQNGRKLPQTAQEWLEIVKECKDKEL